MDVHRSFWPIAPFALLTKHVEEQADGLTLAVEQMHHLLSSRSNPAPGAHKRHLAEQCRLNGKCIEPRHVFFRRDPLDIEVVGLRDDDSRIARSDSAVQ